jgi:putative flippase GtrA
MLAACRHVPAHPAWEEPVPDAPSNLRSLYDAHGEKLRFLIVGGWNSVFSYGLFALLLWLLEPVLAPLAVSSSPALAFIGRNWYVAVQWLSWVLSVPQSTITFKYLVFHGKGHVFSEIGRAFFVYLPLQVLSSLFLKITVSVFGLPPLLGQLLTVSVAAILSYLGHKYFTFRTPAPRFPGE